MFVKIFCGDSQKYLLLQSNDIVIDKEPRCVDYDIYPVLCAYIEEMSLPAGERDSDRMVLIHNEYKRIMELKKQESEAEYSIRPLESLLEDIVKNRHYCFIIPILSDSEDYEKSSIISKCSQSKDICWGVNLCKISVIEIGEKVYLTTGSIYIMNDDGKTIDKI